MGFEPPVKMLPWDPPHEHPATVQEIARCIDAVNLAMAHALITPEQAWQLRQGYAQSSRLIMTPSLDRLESIMKAAEKALMDPNEKNKGSILKQMRGLAKDIAAATKP